MHLILILISLFSFTGHAQESGIETLASKGHYLINGCQIFNFVGDKLRVFPGTMCLFLPDGRLISASDSALRMLNPKLEIIWEIPGKFHHQIQFTKDLKRVLALSSEMIPKDNISYRVDRFMSIEIDTGKIISSARADELLKDHVKLLDDSSLLAEKELSHFNSISDIPKQQEDSYKHSYIKEGNIVVNSLVLGACVLSQDMKEVKKCFSFKRSESQGVHDVSISSMGYIVYFNNHVKMPSRSYSSAFQMIIPETQELVYEWKAVPREAFYSRCCGSAQEFGDFFIISHMMAGTFIVRRHDVKLMRFIPQTHMDGIRLLPSQEVKVAYLGDFLKFWK